MAARRLFAVTAAILLACATLSAQLVNQVNKKVPKPLQQRFVTGDPIWRELPVRSDFQQQYDRVWQTAVNTILEHNFDIATMDKDSGYFRTIQNERLVKMDANWTYKVQISVKLVSTPGDPRSTPPKPTVVDKVRVQVSGEVIEADRRGVVKLNFLGYDQILLQNVFQDLQAKLGSL